MIGTKFTVDGITYTTHYTKGKVVGKDKNMETKIYGGGGGGYVNQGTGTSGSFSVSSRTLIHDKIFIEEENGKERAIELTDWDIACREGHQIVIVWIKIGTNERGPCVAIKNLSTDDVQYGKDSISALAGEPGSFFMPDNLNGWVMSQILILAVGGAVGWLIGNFIFGGALAIPVFAILFIILWHRTREQKISKSKKIQTDLNEKINLILNQFN